jgi:Tfp pilus assembly protein PilO
MALSKRERVIGIATGAVLALLALDQIIVTPLDQRGREASSRVELASAELQRMDQVFQSDLGARRKWRDMAGDTLRSDAPATESQVLNAVRQWAQDSGLTLTSLKPERNEQEKGFHKITIRATAQGGMQQVARFLYAVEVAQIPVRVSDMTLSARREGTDELNLQIGLATIYLPPEPPKNGEATL